MKKCGAVAGAPTRPSSDRFGGRCETVTAPRNKIIHPPTSRKILKFFFSSPLPLTPRRLSSSSAHLVRGKVALSLLS